LNRTYQDLVCADDNLMGENINIIKKNKEAVLNTIKEVSLHVNAEKNISTCCSCLITRRQYRIIVKDGQIL